MWRHRGVWLPGICRCLTTVALENYRNPERYPVTGDYHKRRAISESLWWCPVVDILTPGEGFQGPRPPSVVRDFGSLEMLDKRDIHTPERSLDQLSLKIMNQRKTRFTSKTKFKFKDLASSLPAPPLHIIRHTAFWLRSHKTLVS